MNSLHVIIAELGTYLDSRETFIELNLVCKDWSSIISSQEYKVYWLKSFFHFDHWISANILTTHYRNFKANSVLLFSPLKTDGGESSVEIGNCFENMWAYNASPFSTFYSTISAQPLRENVNCLGFFEGRYQEMNKFHDCFYNDQYSIENTNMMRPENYNIESYDQEETLVLDPLRRKCNNYKNIGFTMRISLRIPRANIKNPRYSTPNSEVAIVSKVAVARPFYYTGPVRTLMILVSEEFNNAEFESFDRYNNIKNFSLAQQIARVKKARMGAEFNVVEYEKGNGFYPLMWIEFLKSRVNHGLFPLSQPHFVRSMNVKMFDIDDRREEFHLPDFQPNFDITYALLIGTVAPGNFLERLG